MVDINFNQTLSDKRLNEILDTLENSENIRSIGYTSHSKVRVTVNIKYYEKFMEKTLTIDDLIEDDMLDKKQFTISILDVTPTALITFEMEQRGLEYYEAMVNQLNELNFPFIKGIFLNYDSLD